MNKDLLFQLYAIHSPSGSEKRMRKFIKRYIRKYCGDVYIEQDVHGNVLCTKGDGETYPCLASHIDQVQHNHSKDFTIVSGGGAVWGYSPKCHAQQGLGADDKNGIYICLECLRKYDNIKCAFFVGEETGCVGSSAVDLSFFADCRFIVEPDRRGSKDLITEMFCGGVCSEDFIKAVGAEEYGYVEEEGSVTDVGELVERGVGISCLNLSCGYYEAHTDHEFTVLAELEQCQRLVEHIIETCVDVYPYEYVGWWSRSKKHEGYRYHNYGYYGDGFFDDDLDYYYGSSQYDYDYDKMCEILKYNPTISLEEIEHEYGMSFYARNHKVLEDLYESCMYDLHDEEKTKAGTLVLPA